jgi:transaldolase/glucose-6-phosphate isomerase
MSHPLQLLNQLGQSPWHDNIKRSLLTSGALKKMIRDGDITGLTSNPTIFEQAVAGSADYDAALSSLARQGKDALAIFDALAIDDIRQAADLFAPVYKRSRKRDGFVSIEVAPNFARDTNSTVAEARRLWKAVDRPNLMVKIPATAEGLPAIETCIAEGININVTLIFSRARYRAVTEAYLRGLERRARAKKPVDHVASVASFFVSRVDTLIDKRLDARVAVTPEVQALMGKAAIANAALAYADFREIFSRSRWEALAARGAQVQRPLWASTSTKNPRYPDTYYIEALIAPDTVDTMPPATLVAYKDHGLPVVRMYGERGPHEEVFEQLGEHGIDMDAVTQQLEDEGVAAFTKSFDALLAVVEQRRQAVLMAARQAIAPGGLARPLAALTAKAAKAELGPRLWRKDSTLWKPDDEAHQAEIKIRMGWLDLPDSMARRVSELTTFAGEVRRAGFTHAILCGMGGSSLAPEVMRQTFGAAKGHLDLVVLDSTDPATVLAAEAKVDLARTLFIIASKSGGTAEINAMYRYFWAKLESFKGVRAGENFIAITDPGTSLERLAAERGFRRTFVNPPEIGGRYSALSLFGLVPAALMGVDIARLLDRARLMATACGPTVAAADNPALQLGLLLAAAHKAKRDKVTFVMAPKLASFGYWVEQLIAESTGKESRGIVPVEGEPLAKPRSYGADRVFAYLRLGRQAALDRGVTALKRAGHPLVTIQLEDAYDLGAEMLRWEIATAVASWGLASNPFDQPNVQEAKDKAKALLAEIAAKGELTDTGASLVAVGASVAKAQLLRHLKSVKPGDYIALMLYGEATPRRERLLRSLQARLRDKTRAAVTVGYGPRFLHSTGQLHKGGANNGVFIQFLVDDGVDAPVPGEAYTFAQLRNAQALGDFQALQARKRRVLRLQLGASIDRNLRAVQDVLD